MTKNTKRNGRTKGQNEFDPSLCEGSTATIYCTDTPNSLSNYSVGQFFRLNFLTFFKVGCLISSIVLAAGHASTNGVFTGTCMLGFFLSSTAPTIISMAEQYVDLTRKSFVKPYNTRHLDVTLTLLRRYFDIYQTSSCIKGKNVFNRNSYHSGVFVLQLTLPVY